MQLACYAYYFKDIELTEKENSELQGRLENARDNLDDATRYQRCRVDRRWAGGGGVLRGI